MVKGEGWDHRCGQVTAEAGPHLRKKERRIGNGLGAPDRRSGNSSAPAGPQKRSRDRRCGSAGDSRIFKNWEVGHFPPFLLGVDDFGEFQVGFFIINDKVS